ncbi:hypothetical protein CEXT_476481 [Caerostris extrusa]|uniref:Uncharacterized protein n=1 Tax=Caerostris extrusa TaxID=172846 RepID=A0AAV4VYE1_CAEEX|nr:hypothetical protein CEXT_476481 [Caerostris extrusa]
MNAVVSLVHSSELRAERATFEVGRNFPQLWRGRESFTHRLPAERKGRRGGGGGRAKRWPMERERDSQFEELNLICMLS